jgi:hypothetical protein
MHALGAGSGGWTAFDDEVIEFFAPHAEGLDYMFVTVSGSAAAPHRREAW